MYAMWNAVLHLWLFSSWDVHIFAWLTGKPQTGKGTNIFHFSKHPFLLLGSLGGTHPYSRYYFELCCTPSTHGMATTFSVPRQLSDRLFLSLCWTINHLQAGKMQQTTQAEGSQPAFLLLSDWDWCCVFFFIAGTTKEIRVKRKQYHWQFVGFLN